MAPQTRRDFNTSLLGALTAYGLIEGVFRSDLFADDVKPAVGKWLTDLNAMGQELKGQKLTDLQFQAKMEELYRKVDLADLIKKIDLDKLLAGKTLPDNGAASIGIDFSMIEGAPMKPTFGKQVFAMKQGRSVVPHGHDNMCTGFIILRGDFQGRHYDRMEDKADHYLIKPTIDRTFKPGEVSTVSDHKDNVHWFTATTPEAFIFNVHLVGYDPNWPKNPGRVYVDPQGEKTGDGLIVAKKMTSRECHKKYG
jgi:hypothetical protein